MARTGWGRHTVVATGSNDENKQISVNAWNNDLDTDGLLGFTKQAGTISGGAIVPTGSVIEVQADGTLDELTPTNNNEFDLLYLIAKSTATSVTIDHDASGGAGKIRLLSGDDETLSTTTPMILMCRTIGSVKEWVQYGGGIVNALDDIGDVTITSVANEDVLAYDSTTSKWINQSADESGRVTASSTNTFTNKTIDADGTGNSITNIENADIKASAGIDATKIADGTVTSAEFQYINTLSSNAQTQINAKQATLTFGIADTNAVKIDGSGTASGEYAKFTSSGVVGEEVADVKTDLSLNNVENTALSTWAGTSNVTTLGTITTGTWTGTDIAIADGGTGQGTAQLAINALTAVSGGTNEYVLTKDTSTGNALWKEGGGGSDTPWSVVHNFADYYYDMEVQTKPSDPAADHGRFYVKEIDSDNDGVFCIIRKNGGFQETQIV